MQDTHALLLLRCLKELIKQATPSNESIRNLETNMDNFISSRNEHIDSIVDDLDSNLPAPKIKEKIKEFREFISTGKTGNLANDAYIDAALNACTALEVPLNEINALSKSAVDTEKLENIKSMLMKITTGWNETSELSSGAAEAAHPMEPVEENDPKKLYARAVEENDPKKLYARANELKELAEQIEHGGGGGGTSPEEMRAQAEELIAQAEALEAEALQAAEEERSQPKRTTKRKPTKQPEAKSAKKKRTKRGGAPKHTTKKHTKKVKSKMLKGKSKKHLTKAKKSKKTGKKVRFHPSSKKSKKNNHK